MGHLLTDVANARVQEEMSALMGLLLREDSQAILNVLQPAYAGDISGSASNVIRVTDYDDAAYNGYGAELTEIGAISPTDPAPAKTDITVARYGFARRPSDLVKMTDSHGMLNPAALATDFAIGANQKLVELVAAVMDDFTATAGTSGAVATVAAFFDACSTLRQAKAGGQLVALLHPKQWGELTKEIATVSGGALQLAESSQQNIISRGSGFQGFLNGVAVYTSTRVASSGGNYQGGIFDPASAIAWAAATPVVEFPDRQILVGKVLFEMDREPLTAETIYAGSVYLGVSERQDAGGVTFISAA